MKNSMFKQLRLGSVPMVIVGVFGAATLLPVGKAIAQDGPPREGPPRETRDGPPREGRDGPPREGRDGPPGGRPPRDRDGGPEDRNGPPGDREGSDRGPADRDGPPPPPRGPGGAGGPGARGTDYEQMRGYMDLVERYAKMARDPSASGVAAVVASSDTLRRQGPKAAADFFEKLLPEVKNETVARAIRIQLADLYRKSGMDDKALAQLKSIITSVPPGTPETKQPE